LYRYDGSNWVIQTIVGSGDALPPDVVAGTTRYLNTTANASGKYDIFQWDGSKWDVVDTVDKIGLDAERPATSTTGFKYYSTDTGNISTYSARGEWESVETVTDEVNTSADLPTSAAANDKYFSLDDKKIYTYSGNTWVSSETGVSSSGPVDPASGGNGEKFFNEDSKQIKTFSMISAWVNPTAKKDETYYYGANADAVLNAGDFTSIYSDGNAGGVVVSSRVILDDAAALPTGSTVPNRTPNKAGETFLDITTGTIYTANNTATGWNAATEKMDAKTAYAVKSITSATSANNIYVLDETGVPAARSTVLDSVNGNKNVFKYNAALGEWKSVNDTQNSATALSPSTQSVTTQQHLTEYGESIIKSRDWEDKFTVYDSRGNPHTMIVVFRKVMDRPAEPNATPPTGAEAEWDWYAYYADSDGAVLPQYGQGAGTMVFGDDGLLKRTYYYEPTPAAPNPNGTNAPTAPEYEWKAVEKIIGDPAYDSVATGKVVADFNLSGAQGSVSNGVYSSNMITLDFLGSDYAKTLGLTSEPIDGVTNYGSTSTTIMKAQDGYAMGVLENWTVSASGVITGSYSNGRNLEISQVALAMFANPQGLSQVGETCFAETINSGIAQIGAAQTNGAGSIQGNTVEMSNVDLSEEFVNLIRAQRGFQASTRVVTTSDEVLQELINLKR
jgi:flagellar hook-basal body protein